jgi:cytochrome c-type biogenesis protein CcmF
MNEIGFYTILIALFLSAYSSCTALYGIKSRAGEMIASAENAAIAVFGLLSIACAALIYALITRDFQVEYVAKYTSRNLSTVYTFAAFYAGQKGSLLFWGWLLSLFTTIVIFQNRKKKSRTLALCSHRYDDNRFFLCSFNGICDQSF